MTVENKRKLRSSMSPPAFVPPKRRHSVRNLQKTMIPGAFPQSSSPPPPYSASPPIPASYLDRNPRPPRWRKSHAEARQPVLESIYKSPSPEPDPIQHSYGLRTRQQQQQRQKSVELRFSFSQSVDGVNAAPKGRMGRNVFREFQDAHACSEGPEVVNRSFSNLSFEQENTTRASTPRAQSIISTDVSRPHLPYASKVKATEVWARQTSSQSRSTTQVQSRASAPQLQAKPATNSRMPTISEFSKPKREGYGFSFSDTAFYDSDEYPDTECDFDPNPIPKDDTAPSPTDFQDTSFEDLVVIRDVGSFHLARPQRRLPCTTATREDTIRLKTSAKDLLKYNESQDVYADLISRLERMVQISGNETSAAVMIVCAVKLKNFLVRVAKERVETGEVRTFVEHEVEWAKWLVEASHTGVMHLRGEGCQCRPDWEE